MEDDIVAKVREILKMWDDGRISLGDFEGRIQRLFWDPVAWLEKGETVMAFGSCCCSSHPPDRTFRVEITVQPHGYTAKRCE
jgi:hypothetical protein